MKSGRILLRQRGGPSVLEWDEQDVCEPAKGEVRVGIQTAGVSYADMLM